MEELIVGGGKVDFVKKETNFKYLVPLLLPIINVEEGGSY